MRVRERDTRTWLLPYRERWLNENGPSPIYTVTNFGPEVATSGNSQKTTDEVTPNYHSRRSRGEVILNYFGSEKVFETCDIDGPEVKLDYAPVGGYWNRYLSHGAMVLNLPKHAGSEYGLPNPFSVDEINTVAELAANKAWTRVYDSEVDLQTSLIELRRTISLLLNPISNARTFLKKVRRLKDQDRTAQGLTLAQYIAREWLTFRYGWSQLYRDFRGVLKATEREKRTGLQKAFGKYTDTRTWTTGFSSSFNGGGYLVDVEMFTTQKVTSRVGIFYEAELSTKTYLGLTWYDMLSTVWEVIPYSFVVDWVFSVQDYLAGLLRKAAVPTKGSYVTTEVDTITVTSIGDHTLLGGDYVAYGTFTKECTGKRVVRSVSKERKTPAPDPGLHLDLKIGSLIDIRVLDGIALIINLLNRR